MAAKKDHWQLDTALAQSLLDTQTAHPGHAHIKQHTRWQVFVTRLQKRLAIGKRQRLNTN
ncbi:hypothetical protein D3C85_1402010 [compost metagenome]